MLLPGFTIGGLNINVVCAGNPDTVNEIGVVEVKPFAVGVTLMGIIAVTPALTVLAAPGPATVNPSMGREPRR